MSRFTASFLFWSLIFLSGRVPLPAQETIRVRGAVLDANNHGILSDVNIYLKGSGFGTITRPDGSFVLRIPQTRIGEVLVFDHVGYETLELPVSEARTRHRFYLIPRVIPLPGVGIEGKKEETLLDRDIPQPVTVIESRRFDARGYVDPGDLLRMEQSAQVDEELSGRKTVAIRGGNPDDVLVLYNGIKLNNLYDNVVDLSLINLDDVRELEVIRGSNTALYGAEAVSGIINILPKTYKNYTIRFQQKIGTYASGAWNVQVNRNINSRINLSYSYKRGGIRRTYADSLDGYRLDNDKSFHTASFIYDLTPENGSRPRDISLLYFQSDLEYVNRRYEENLDHFQQFAAGRFRGDIAFIRKLDMALSWQKFRRNQNTFMSYTDIRQHFLNQSALFRVQKTFTRRPAEATVGYQYEDNRLDVDDDRVVLFPGQAGIRSASVLQKRQGVVGVFKLAIPSESDGVEATDVHVSYRRDWVEDRFQDVRVHEPLIPEPNQQIAVPEDKTWSQSMLKFSSHFRGGDDRYRFDVYMTYGSNFKFPTVFQQISMPAPPESGQDADRYALRPERNSAAELGAELIREVTGDENVAGWRLYFNYFRNDYSDKIRTCYVPYSPIAFYDNAGNAEISGLEIQGTLYLLKKKLCLEAGSSNYAISEKSAFPFKSAHKHVFNVLVEHAGFSVQIHGFMESDQVGWVRDEAGAFSEVRLPGYSNVDVHASRSLTWLGTRFFFNFSGRNLFDSDAVLEGLAFRDRRYYVTLGFQY